MLLFCTICDYFVKQLMEDGVTGQVGPNVLFLVEEENTAGQECATIQHPLMVVMIAPAMHRRLRLAMLTHAPVSYMM